MFNIYLGRSICFQYGDLNTLRELDEKQSVISITLTLITFLFYYLLMTFISIAFGVSLAAVSFLLLLIVI